MCCTENCIVSKIMQCFIFYAKDIRVDYSLLRFSSWYNISSSVLLEWGKMFFCQVSINGVRLVGEKCLQFLRNLSIGLYHGLCPSFSVCSLLSFVSTICRSFSLKSFISGTLSIFVSWSRPWSVENYFIVAWSSLRIGIRLLKEVGGSRSKSRHDGANLSKLLGDVMNQVAVIAISSNHVIVEGSCLAVNIVLENDSMKRWEMTIKTESRMKLKVSKDH